MPDNLILRRNFITFFYIIPLVIIALLNMASYYSVSQVESYWTYYFRIINESGKHRMLSQKLVKDILLVVTSGDWETKLRYFEMIPATYEKWTIAHRRLINNDSEGKFTIKNSPKLESIFKKMEPGFLEMKNSIGRIINLDSASLGELNVASPLIRNTVNQSERFLVEMDQIVSQYEREVIHQTDQHKTTKSYILLGVLLLLVFEGLFIFRPITKKIRKTLETLHGANNELEQKIRKIIETEETVKRMEEWKSTILNSTADGIITIDDEGRVDDLNPAAESIFGYSSREAKGSLAEELFFPPELRKKYSRCLKKIIAGKIFMGKPFVTPAKIKTGNNIIVEIVLNAIYFDDRFYITSFIRNVTERKQSEEKMMRLVSAVEQVADGILITDVNGAIQYGNPAFEKLTGYSLAEIKNKNPRFLKSGNHDDDFYLEMWKTIRSGKVWNGKITNKRKDGTLYEEMQTISPVWNDSKEIINFISIKRDITQEGKIEEHLRRSQKMEAIGILSGGIAHDFNNILTPILGYSELLKKELPQDSKALHDVCSIHKAALRAKDLVSQILLFSRQKKGESLPCNLTGIIKEVLKLLGSVLPKTIAIIPPVNPTETLVNVDITQFHTLLMNLCTNASHAMPGGGELKIDLEEVDLQDFEIPSKGIISGKFIRLEVSDTGVGMDEEVLEHIFEPFFTTKDVGRGTGLGLSTVFGIVEQHGGYITVSSTLGKGSKFQVFLPVYTGRIEENTKLGNIPVIDTDKSILLLDDEVEIVKMGKRGLEKLGFKVTGISHPLEALELIKSNPDKFDLVITDQTMPGMTGDKFAEALEIICPEMPIIISTGNYETITQKPNQNQGVKSLLFKPFTSHELGEVVNKVFNLKVNQTLLEETLLAQ